MKKWLMALLVLLIFCCVAVAEIYPGKCPHNVCVFDELREEHREIVATFTENTSGFVSGICEICYEGFIFYIGEAENAQKLVCDGTTHIYQSGAEILEEGWYGNDQKPVDFVHGGKRAGRTNNPTSQHSKDNQTKVPAWPGPTEWNAGKRWNYERSEYRMELAKIMVSGANARVVSATTITKGMTGAQIEISYEGDMWEMLDKTVVFRCVESKHVTGAAKIVEIPAEVLCAANVELMVSIVGTAMGTDGYTRQVVPTPWVSLGMVQDSAFVF